MILTADEIEKHVASGKIILRPFVVSQLGTVSYKFQLGNRISAINNFLDSKKPLILKFEEIPEGGYILEPGTLYLVQTYEVMGAYDFAQQIFATRDVGSAGIFIHISADLGHSGAITHWTLEITTDHRITIYPRQIIGQIIFWKLDGHQSFYNGEYQDMSQCLPSKQWKKFND